MAEIQSLYSIVRGFRHDLGNLVISMSLAIEEEIFQKFEESIEKYWKKVIKKLTQKNYQDLI